MPSCIVLKSVGARVFRTEYLLYARVISMHNSITRDGELNITSFLRGRG